MSFLDRLFPALTIIITTFLVAVPWGMAAENRFILPPLPLIVIHYWTVRRPSHVAEWLVFGAGLGLDILTNGPIGFWALIYLLGYAAAIFSSPRASDGPLAKWLLSTATLFVLTGVAWCVSSLYYFELADWRPYAWAGIAASLIYPIIGIMLGGVNSGHRERRNILLERGM